MEDEERTGCLNVCGFKSGLWERYLACEREGRTKAQLRLLWQQRKRLMEDLHTVQKQVDSIDFIIRSVERTEARKD